jgi:serine/threonine protein kinase
MAQVSHPNIVEVFDVIRDVNGLSIVMDYVEGGSLRSRMQKDTPMSAAAVRTFLPPVVDALEVLHDHKILHRDLKPENILLQNGRGPKIVDFGLSVPSSAVGHLTRSGEGLGTPGYVAPEQQYRLETDSRADQYSLVAVVYEMLTGKCPLGVIKPPSQFQPGLLPRVDQVLLRSLDEDPEARYPDIRQFGDDLDSALAASSRTPVNGLAAAASIIVSLGLIAAVLITTTKIFDASPASPDEVPRVAAEAESRGQELRNALDITLVRISAGQFDMGAAPSHADARPEERPQRRVVISKPFYLGATEVTVAQFRQFTEATGYETIESTGFFHSREGYQLIRQDGKSTPVDVTVSRIHIDPEPLGLVVVRDVSERTHSEELLRETNKRLSDALTELASAQKQIVEQERL